MEREGLRERKKRQTRQAIADAARRLFLEKGFAAVTVAQVAAAADVSEATVFNYFPTKEDLFFSGMEAFEAQLVDAVRSRASGESALGAFRRAVMASSRRLAHPRSAHALASAARIILATPALQDRERAVVAEQAAVLADVLREDGSGDGLDVERRVVATALMSVHAALVQHVRTLALQGARGPELKEAFEDHGARAFDRLQEGLAEYAVRG